MDSRKLKVESGKSVGKWIIDNKQIGKESGWTALAMTDLIPEALLGIEGWARDKPVAFFYTFMEWLRYEFINDRNFMSTP